MYSKMFITIKIKYQFYFIKRKVKKTKIKLIKINILTKKNSYRDHELDLQDYNQKNTNSNSDMIENAQ